VDRHDSPRPLGDRGLGRGSMSAKTGAAPRRAIASAVAKKVYAVVTTSSPGPMPSACSPSSMASVPLATATAWP